MANLCRQEDSPSTKVTVSESDSVGEGDGDGKGGGDGDVGGRYEEAPKPLLPNYGAANEMAYTIDITVSFLPLSPSSSMPPRCTNHGPADADMPQRTRTHAGRDACAVTE